MVRGVDEAFNAGERESELLADDGLGHGVFGGGRVWRSRLVRNGEIGRWIGIRDGDIIGGLPLFE